MYIFASLEHIFHDSSNFSEMQYFPIWQQCLFQGSDSVIILETNGDNMLAVGLSAIQLLLPPKYQCFLILRVEGD